MPPAAEENLVTEDTAALRIAMPRGSPQTGGRVVEPSLKAQQAQVQLQLAEHLFASFAWRALFELLDHLPDFRLDVLGQVLLRELRRARIGHGTDLHNEVIALAGVQLGAASIAQKRPSVVL
jgi:hypothetical protein